MSRPHAFHPSLEPRPRPRHGKLTRRIDRRVALGALPVAALLISALLLGCFSETPETTALPGGGECAPLDVGSQPFGSVIVAIEDFAFQPATIRIAPGTRVTWINCEPEGTPEHTTTSDEGSADAWDSPLLSRGETFSRTFNEAGEFPYHCEPHPYMQATVVVE